MTPEMRAGLEALIAEWQGRLKLGNWDIRLADEPPNSDERACTNIWLYKLSAIVHVQPDAPESVWPELVIHELLHVVLARLLRGPVENHLAQFLSPSAKVTADAALKDEEEQLIHQLTVAFTGRPVQVWRSDDPIWRSAFGVAD